MLEGGRMKNEISAWDGATAGFKVSHIANVEFDFVSYIRILGLVLVTHVVLFFLIAGEDADFPDVGAEKALKDSVPERSSASTNQEDFVFEN